MQRFVPHLLKLMTSQSHYHILGIGSRNLTFVDLTVSCWEVPGPTQLSVTCSTESWAGPGNEATQNVHNTMIDVLVAFAHARKLNI